MSTKRNNKHPATATRNTTATRSIAMQELEKIGATSELAQSIVDAVIAVLNSENPTGGRHSRVGFTTKVAALVATSELTPGATAVRAVDGTWIGVGPQYDTTTKRLVCTPRLRRIASLTEKSPGVYVVSKNATKLDLVGKAA